MINIWFEPHATSIDNEDGRADVDLTSKGLAQAKEMVGRCRRRGIDAIFCSDLQRAVKTAIPTATELGLAIYTDKNLRECNYGELTRKPKALVEAEKIEHLTVPFANGQSYEQCMGQMGLFLDRLKAEFDDKTVLIIGHRATHYGLDHHIGGKPLEACVTEDFKWQRGWQYRLQ